MSLELLIIGLHKIGDAPPAAKIKGLFLSSGQLKFYLSLLREMKFEFATLKDAVTKKHGKFAVVTFDDGYTDNLKNGFPVLQKMEIPATVFVITEDVGKSNISWHEAADDLPEDLLSWEQLKFLQDKGWEIGSHNHQHIHLSRRTASEQEETILLSIEEIRRNMGIEPVSFAYPYGDYQPTTKNILKSCGVKYAVTTQPTESLKFEKTSDLLELPRVSLAGSRKRHYARNLSRLAKVLGFNNTLKALTKTLFVTLTASANLATLLSRFRKENS